MPHKSVIKHSLTLHQSRQMGCVTVTEYADLHELMTDIMMAADEYCAPTGWDMMDLQLFPITVGGNTRWSGNLCFIFDKDL